MFDLDRRAKQKASRRRRPPSYLRLWPHMIRVMLVMGLVLWILWIVKARLEAPPPRRPPPPDTVLFVDSDAAP